MELSFEHAPDRQSFVLRFQAGTHASVPMLRELRFWGVDRVPCPSLSTLAALLSLKHHALKTVTLREVAMSPPVCTALAAHFGVEIHPARYDADRRDLIGGDKAVAPIRFARLQGQSWPMGAVEVLPWVSLDDFDGALGGSVRTNVDAFGLTEAEKDVIVALCCGGREIGHVLVDSAEPDLARLFHRLGLELLAR